MQLTLPPESPPSRLQGRPAAPYARFGVKNFVRTGQSFSATLQGRLRRRSLSALLDLALKGKTCAVACGQATVFN